MPLTPDQIQRLVAEHVRRCVAEIEDAHFSRKRPLDPDESEERLESLDEFDVMLREQIGTADYALVATVARELLKEQGIELGLEDVDFNRLCDAILQAGFTIHDHERKLLLGLPRSPLTHATLAGPDSAGSPAPAQLICTRTVSDLQGEFIQDRLSARQFGYATSKDYEATLAELVEHLGDRNPDEYSKTELNTHRDILFRLPKHRRKSPKYRDAPLAQLLEQDIPSSDLRSETTVAEAIRRISTFFNWCKAMEFCEKNNAETVTVNAEKKQRDAFTPEELHAIFHSDFYVRRKLPRQAHTRKVEFSAFWIR